MIVDLEPDSVRRMTLTSAGGALDALEAKNTRWPGGTLPPDVPYQYVEGEYMREDEYDLFLSDPTDFILRYQLPRMYGALAPLTKLPPLRNLGSLGFASFSRLFASPEFVRFAQALLAAGQAQDKYHQVAGSFDDDMGQLGFPPAYHAGGGIGGAPFDAISDFYRGMRGSMIDMHRHPDKLLAACEKVAEWRVAASLPSRPNGQKPAAANGQWAEVADVLDAPVARSLPGGRKTQTRAFMPLHRGAEGFMSVQQFEKFYWPTLKKVILADVEIGCIPMPFWEGKCDSRLEYLLELPKGKVICHFQDTDMFRAKEILGNHLCIMGNVPSSMLQVGSPSEVEEYCAKLIKVCGKGGGFILTAGSAIDEANPANVQAMIDSAKKYSP
ncbi:MAG: hypothetical protein KGJ86_22340, partial [Chloroflexota bacterium]|nr:hypothetical protein [Chloroflexota bacterium]